MREKRGNGSNDEMEILFQFLRYWGLQHNWNMRNAFMFDNRHGVKAYIKKLKGILMWNFWMLVHVGIISPPPISNTAPSPPNIFTDSLSFLNNSTHAPPPFFSHNLKNNPSLFTYNTPPLFPNFNSFAPTTHPYNKSNPHSSYKPPPHPQTKTRSYTCRPKNG